eukprot:6312546-Amphidinium_carterae.2
MACLFRSIAKRCVSNASLWGMCTFVWLLQCKLAKRQAQAAIKTVWLLQASDQITDSLNVLST